LDLFSSNWLDLSKLAAINDNSGLDFRIDLQGGAVNPANLNSALQGIDLLSQYTTPNQYGALIDALLGSGVTDFVVETGKVEISDTLAAALVDAGMLQALPAANLVIDATQSGMYLHTSLADMAGLGIDGVKIATGTAKVYVEFGLPHADANAMAEIKALLSSLDPSENAKFISSDDSTAHDVGLVIHGDLANALAESGFFTDQSIMDSLGGLGITEINILDNSGTNVHDSVGVVAQSDLAPVDVKIIGQSSDEDDLFGHFTKPNQ
jgi:hypothetical protein